MNPTYTFAMLSHREHDSLTEDERMLCFNLASLQATATRIGTMTNTTMTVYGRVVGERDQYRCQVSGTQAFDQVWRTSGALEDRLHYTRAMLLSIQASLATRREGN